jgi:DNA (cytosine-5)-methyltransferase 1
MTHASVFSGIGGPEVAAAMLGWENLFHCEINPFGRKVLEYWFPKSKSYEDITKTDFSEWRGRVNVLTGGFPCQPFSCAGKRRGETDDRYLWPHMHRCINEIKPDWFIGENVAGILTMVEQGNVSKVATEAALFDEIDSVYRYEYRGTFTLERICQDVEADGYEVFPILIPACAVGAPHRRDRVFIVGHRKDSDISRGPIRGGGESSAQHGGGRSAEHSSSGRAKMPNDPSWTTQNEWSGIGETGRTTPDTDSHRGLQVHEHMEPKQSNGAEPICNGWQWNVTNTESERTRRLRIESEEERPRMRDVVFGNGCRLRRTPDEIGSRWRVFPSVSPIHRGNDGLPFDVDNLTISFPKWRNESVKAYGNAIVPQVMYEIFLAILKTEQQLSEL